MAHAPEESQAAPDPGDAADLAFATALRDALRQATAAATIAAAPGADQFLERLVRTAATAIPSTAASLLVVDPVVNGLTFAVALGPAAAAVTAITVPLGRGIAGLVAVSGQPLAIANADQDPRHARDIAERAGYLPATILAVPVIVAGTVTGVLELLDRDGGASFTLADMELLGQFAELCAGALDQRRAETLQTELIASALAALGGLPAAAHEALVDQAAALAARVAADPATGRTGELARQVATIAARGEAERQVCARILAAFAEYLAATPAPGAGIEGLGLPLNAGHAWPEMRS